MSNMSLSYTIGCNNNKYTRKIKRLSHGKLRDWENERPHTGVNNTCTQCDHMIESHASSLLFERLSRGCIIMYEHFTTGREGNLVPACIKL